MATACCRAAEVLHTAGVVHRNFRMANIVQLKPEVYMVIDLETVGRKVANPLPASFALTGWNSRTLNKARKYTTASDMHQIGLMIEEQLQGVVEASEEAWDFCEHLMRKNVSAKGALKHAWLLQE